MTKAVTIGHPRGFVAGSGGEDYPAILIDFNPLLMLMTVKHNWEFLPQPPEYCRVLSSSKPVPRMMNESEGERRQVPCAA